MKGAWRRKVPAASDLSAAEASQNVVADSNAQEWLTQSSIAKIEKAAVKEPPSPRKRGPPVSKSHAPTKLTLKPPPQKAQAERNAVGIDQRPSKRDD